MVQKVKKSWGSASLMFKFLLTTIILTTFSVSIVYAAEDVVTCNAAAVDAKSHRDGSKEELEEDAEDSFDDLSLRHTTVTDEYNTKIACCYCPQLVGEDKQEAYDALQLSILAKIVVENDICDAICDIDAGCLDYDQRAAGENAKSAQAVSLWCPCVNYSHMAVDDYEKADVHVSEAVSAIAEGNAYLDSAQSILNDYCP